MPPSSDYGARASSGADAARRAVQSGLLVGAAGGGAGCGGEILMAEATTGGSPISEGSDGTFLSIPVVVDTANTRIRVAAHLWLSGSGAGSPVFTITGPDGTARSIPADNAAAWHQYTIEVPALLVIAPGSYSITAAISGTSGTTLIGYQVLVYLVTSG